MDLDSVIQGDCLEVLARLEAPIADLVFADPPFNIGYKYDLYEDKRKYDEYHRWTHEWMRLCVEKALKPSGTFWVAIGDDYAAEVKKIGDGLGLHFRTWVIWHYTFGQNTKKKFARSHTHLLYWTASPDDFTFNDQAIRVFSDRLREYKDVRANDTGKLPDDVWSEFPRVCGTFKEREGWHPCQMPEPVLARIIRATSSQGDVVLDPFAGSGTTLVVAKKLNRHFIGIELSPDYVASMKERLSQARNMGMIEGVGKGNWPEEHIQELKNLYIEVGVATDELHKNEQLLFLFADQLAQRLQAGGCRDSYGVPEVWQKLESLRKAGKLGRIRIHAREPREEREPLLLTGRRRKRGD